MRLSSLVHVGVATAGFVACHPIAALGCSVSQPPGYDRQKGALLAYERATAVFEGEVITPHHLISSRYLPDGTFIPGITGPATVQAIRVYKGSRKRTFRIQAPASDCEVSLEKKGEVRLFVLIGGPKNYIMSATEPVDEINAILDARRLPGAPPRTSPEITEPVWMSRPTPSDILAVFPTFGRIDRSGAATLRCAVRPDGRLSGCLVEEEVGGLPGDQRFGRAALKLVPLYQMAPLDGEGKPVGRRKVHIKVMFRITG